MESCLTKLLDCSNYGFAFLRRYSGQNGDWLLNVYHIGEATFSEDCSHFCCKIDWTQQVSHYHLKEVKDLVEWQFVQNKGLVYNPTITLAL